MATNPFNTPRLNTDLIDIFNDNASVARISMVQLPSGGCNFVDLNQGSSASKCGCRRFWACPAQSSPMMDQSGYCMCKHHACYHDQDARDMPQPDPAVATMGLENVKPSTGRDPLSPLYHLDLNMAPIATPKADFTTWSGVDQLSFLQQSLGGAIANIGEASPQLGASMPDTLAWPEMGQPQPDPSAALPPVPPQCLMPSQATSTTSSVQAKYIRPFAGKGLHTLKAATTAKQTPSQSQFKPTDPVSAQQQPKIQGFAEPFVFEPPKDQTPARPGTASTQIEPRTNPENFNREDVRSLTDIINAHAQRLDRLETVSFTAVNHDDCIDRHENVDVRLAELESRMEESEKLAQAHGSNRQDDDASVSNASTTSSAANRPGHSEDVYGQIQSLQAQVSHLQSYIPSMSHKWEVEVVFLPFPLKRVWQNIRQFKDPATILGDGWSQLPMTHSTSVVHPFSHSQSAYWGGEAMRDHEMERLLPRACSEQSVTDMRLRSRGLVQRISVNGPDAWSVQTAILTVFGSVFRDMQMHSRSFESTPHLSRFGGLQSSWVPLRKIHKDSRLRFLSPDEMVTPALWNVEFLNSVMMKGSEPRLFITHPDAYLQDRHAYETGWTWQKLKDITSPCPDFTESQQVPEVQDPAECWVWNELLDGVQGVPMPVTHKNHDRRRVSISPSVAYMPAPLARRSTSPMVTRDQISGAQNRRDSRGALIRTASVPLGTAAQGSFSNLNPNRRVAPNGQSRRTTPVQTTRIAQGAGVKKRRQTRSPPSHAQNTPRRTASPSPMPSVAYDRQPTRSTTPYTYATPHSNAPLQEIRYVRGASVLRQSVEGNSTSEETADEGDDEIDMYNDDSDVSIDEGDADVDEATPSPTPISKTLARPKDPPVSSSFRVSEDEPFTGFDEAKSDSENMDPLDVDEEMGQPSDDEDDEEENDKENNEVIDEEIAEASDASSQPSEYPTAQSAWPGDVNGEGNLFRIHEDKDVK